MREPAVLRGRPFALPFEIVPACRDAFARRQWLDSDA